MKQLLTILLISMTAMISSGLADDPITISPDTTFLTGPLREDGRGVDYFAALEEQLYPDTMQTDDNGYRIIVRELGALAFEDLYLVGGEELDEQSRNAKTERLRVLYYEKLGLDPEIEPKTTFECPFAYIMRYCEENDQTDEIFDEFYDKYHRPWTGDDLPIMVAWVEENSPALDVVAQAVTQPDFYVPLIRRDENIRLVYSAWSLEVQLMRDFARAFSARANYRIGTGDIDGAIDDVIACKRLGRRLNHMGGAVQTLIGIAAEGIAGAVDLGFNEDAPLTEEQLLRLAQAWNDPPPRATLNDCMFVERIYLLEYVQGVALGNYPLEMHYEDSRFWKALTKIEPDWNDVMRRVNHHCSLVNGLPHKTLGEWRDWKRWSPMKLFTRGQAPSELLADCLTYELLPHTTAMQEAIWRSQCCDQVKALTLAMLLYEQQHGELPPPFTVDAAGNPLHSWRVLLLPYLGRQELYDQIRLDEPWDSVHNRQFHDVDVPCFACPSSEAKTGETTYSVVIGEDTAFHEGRPEAGPETNMQILVVERQTPVNWMDPTQEFTDRPPETEWDNWINNDEDERIGSKHPGGANFGLRSSGVTFFSEMIPNETFQKLLEGTCPLEELP